jgi:hypothetical protein
VGALTFRLWQTKSSYVDIRRKGIHIEELQFQRAWDRSRPGCPWNNKEVRCDGLESEREGKGEGGREKSRSSQRSHGKARLYSMLTPLQTSAFILSKMRSHWERGWVEQTLDLMYSLVRWFQFTIEIEPWLGVRWDGRTKVGRLVKILWQFILAWSRMIGMNVLRSKFWIFEGVVNRISVELNVGYRKIVKNG